MLRGKGVAMTSIYQDRWIDCTTQGVQIRGYYFPWGSKSIPYSRIQLLRRVSMTRFGGKGRIWGTASPGYWASLDPHRPRKSTALILDLGVGVKPFITPDDPDAVIAAILDHTDIMHVIDDQGDGPVV